LRNAIVIIYSRCVLQPSGIRRRHESKSAGKVYAGAGVYLRRKVQRTRHRASSAGKRQKARGQAKGKSHKGRHRPTGTRQQIQGTRYWITPASKRHRATSRHETHVLF